ncbi:MAG: Magnesium and cobalt efflux protein CorC [Micavibrio sp.]|nr:Magnesium and cobalt efflux protein CorC [Micavibrio sp.]
MTDKIDSDPEPSSIEGATRPPLHIVHEDDPAPVREPRLRNFVRNMLGGNRQEDSLHETLKEFVSEDNVDASLAADERSLIKNILAMRDLRAVDVMIPRADIVAIDSSISTQDLFTLLSERQFSRFPVYKETLDDVIGTLHIKDILACLARGQPIVIDNIVRDVPIVSPAMHVLDLLLEMKTTRRHIALIVDEFGGIDGLVTVGDIIEAIVGEIEDEHEVSDQPQLLITPDGTILADGRVDIETFENRFGTFMTDEEREDIDTLGGLVFAIAGHVPARGEVVSHDSGLVFEVLDADPRRVHRLRIKNIPKEPVSE